MDCFKRITILGSWNFSFLAARRGRYSVVSRPNIQLRLCMDNSLCMDSIISYKWVWQCGTLRSTGSTSYVHSSTGQRNGNGRAWSFKLLEGRVTREACDTRACEHTFEQWYGHKTLVTLTRLYHMTSLPAPRRVTSVGVWLELLF